jgi:hypothetical protein
LIIMAKGSTATVRTPITATGVALLALIAASEVPAPGVLMLTQDEGKEAVDAGYAVVDTTVVDGNTAAVSLTDAGRAALTVTEATPTGAAAAAGFEIEADVPLPSAAGRRARSGGYPFDALQVNQSFHVPALEGKTLDESLATLSSSVAGARAKYAVQDGDKVADVTVKTYKKGEDGKFIKDEKNKRVVESETTESRPVMLTVRDFTAAKVTAADPKGEGIRIWRIK